MTDTQLAALHFVNENGPTVLDRKDFHHFTSAGLAKRGLLSASKAGKVGGRGSLSFPADTVFAITNAGRDLIATA
jgi:hypothetical protein